MTDLKTGYNRSYLERIMYNPLDTIKWNTFSENKYIPILGFKTNSEEENKDLFSFKFDLKKALSMYNNKNKTKSFEIKKPKWSSLNFNLIPDFDTYSKVYLSFNKSKATYLKTKNPYFNDMVKFVVDNLEGGYSDHIYDKGGKTYRGVTTATYDRFRKMHKLPIQDVRKMTEVEMNEIYYGIFKDCGADKIEDPRLAFYVFDIAIGSGSKIAKQILAKSGGDLDKIEQLRRAKYQAIVKHDPTQKVFLKGWNNRVDKNRKFIDEKYPVVEQKPNPIEDKKLKEQYEYIKGVKREDVIYKTEV